MKKYIIVTSNSLSGLEYKVNEKLDEGYFVIGVIGMTTCGVGQSEKTFYQPMKRR